jgi:hypothetical protein
MTSELLTYSVYNSSLNVRLFTILYPFLLLPLGAEGIREMLISLQFLNFIEYVGPLGRGISPTQGRYLHRTTQTQIKRREISIPWVAFEPTISAIEQAKTVHALDREATVIGIYYINIEDIMNWIRADKWNEW